MPRRRVLLSAILVLSALSVLPLAARSTPAGSTDLPKLDIDFYTLPNGLQVILYQDHSTPIVAVNTWYHVGSKNERPGRTGFAHLFEHMMFQGSEHHDDEYFGPLQSVGAQLNGSTSEDRTNYWQVVPRNHLQRVLMMESDRMGWLLPAMTEEKFKNQQDVVRNERRQSEGRPYAVYRLNANAGHLSQGTSLRSQRDRLPRGPRGRLPGGREGLLPHLLHAEQRDPLHRRRFRSRPHQEVDRGILRGDSPGSADRGDRGLGAHPRPREAGAARGPGPAHPPLLRLALGRRLSLRGRRAEPGRHHPRPGEDQPPLPPPGSRHPARPGRLRPPGPRPGVLDLQPPDHPPPRGHGGRGGEDPRRGAGPLPRRRPHRRRTLPGAERLRGLVLEGAPAGGLVGIDQRSVEPIQPLHRLPGLPPEGLRPLHERDPGLGARGLRGMGRRRPGGVPGGPAREARRRGPLRGGPRYPARRRPRSEAGASAGGAGVPPQRTRSHGDGAARASTGPGRGALPLRAEQRPGR